MLYFTRFAPGEICTVLEIGTTLIKLQGLDQHTEIHYISDLKSRYRPIMLCKSKKPYISGTYIA